MSTIPLTNAPCERSFSLQKRHVQEVSKNINPEWSFTGQLAGQAELNDIED